MAHFGKACLYLAFNHGQGILAFAPQWGEFSAKNTLVATQNRYKIVMEAAPPPKKRRKRKKAPGTSASLSPPSTGADGFPTTIQVGNNGEAMNEDDIATMKDIASFKPEGGDIAKGIQDDKSADCEVVPEPFSLPDIKDQLKKKAREEEIAIEDAAEAAKTPKIKRSDRAAFQKLLEQDVYADGDDSLFEEEAYGTVAALLGERAEPFLSIPFGPLQVGHFIGALGIALMAFVEYPGFPLTNLPTSLRDCLQGGLGTVFAINAVLAVLSTFKAGERGQNPVLWAVKTFSVGGLAYDQLTQLPTKDELKRLKNQKGARAFKNRKR